MEITPASLDVSKNLGLVPGTLILANTFTNFFKNGQPAEAVVMSYRIDLVKFKFAASGTSMLLNRPPAMPSRRVKSMRKA